MNTLALEYNPKTNKVNVIKWCCEKMRKPPIRAPFGLQVDIPLFYQWFMVRAQGAIGLCLLKGTEATDNLGLVIDNCPFCGATIDIQVPNQIELVKPQSN